jgi:glycosyltransferase involved in cell wall biosynthesis
LLNFDHIIRSIAKTTGEGAIVAAPYPLPDVTCRQLVSEGLIAGYVLVGRPAQDIYDPAIAGWWVDRAAGIWFIRRLPGRSVLILLSAGPGIPIGGALLLEARLKGIRRIICAGGDGSIVSDVDVEATLGARLNEEHLARPFHTLGYDDFFRDLYDLVGDRLRLPYHAHVSDRMLIVTGNLQAGGAERQVAYTASGLARRFPGQVHLGCSRSGSEADFFKPMLEAAGVGVWVMPNDAMRFETPDIVEIRQKLVERYETLGALSIFYMIFHQALLIRAVRPGLVHTWQDYSNVLAGIAADLVGVPRLVLSGRSLAPDNFNIFQPYMKPAYQAMLNRRKVAFLNNSEAGALDYSRWLGVPRQQFRVVRNGFEFPDMKATSARSDERYRLGIPEDSIVVGSIMRFGEEKRPLLWMEMARELHQDHPHVRFLLFGHGPMLESCRAFATANGLGEAVTFAGLTSDAWAALAAMDIFVLTSRLEGLPNVIIEAQSMGLPVVCSGAGGMSETFVDGSTGIAVPSSGAEDLARAVAGLLENPDLRNRMGSAARIHARATFGIERMLDETLDAYAGTPIYEPPALRPPDWAQADHSAEIPIGGAVSVAEHCFVAAVPSLDPSAWELYEEDHPLRIDSGKQSPEALVKRGHYRLDETQVFFSSSDGSDIRFNGRFYRLLPKGEPPFEDIVIDITKVNQEGRHCYVVSLDIGPGAERSSLWEDDRRLGPGGSLHDEIRSEGMGRYSVWGTALYFSTSDGSDPRVNRRTYLLRRTRIVPTQEDLSDEAAPSHERALHLLLANTKPRQDFVPGRIIHIGGSLSPGGAERQIFYTLRGLAQEPVESVQLLCYHLDVAGEKSFFLQAFETNGLAVRMIQRQVGWEDSDHMPLSLREVRHALPRNLVLDIADLFWEFVRLRPEVVHAWLDGNNERAAIAAALAGVPRIVIAGRNMNPSHFPYLFQPHMAPIYRALLDLPQVTMLNNSRAGRDDYADWLGVDRDRIDVVYNGIDFGVRKRSSLTEIADTRRSLGIDASAFVVGGILRFSPEKRPILWIETAAEVARVLPNARFVIYGRGDMKEEIEHAILRLGLKDRVILAGITPDVLPALSMMDVLLTTSEQEGLPNVVLEAQWVGTPVVATDAGGTAEALEDGVTGWIVAPATAADLARQINWLHTHPEKRTAAHGNGPELVKRRFSVNRMVEETLECYRLSEAMPKNRVDSFGVAKRVSANATGG